MKVELGVFERLWLLNNALPKKSSAVNLRITQELISVLGLKAEELKELSIREEDGHIVWDNSKEQALEIDLSEAQVELLAQSLKDLDEKGELELALLPLYDKFVGEGA